MELTKTVKVQLYANEDEKAILHESMKAYSAACSFISHYVYETRDMSQASVQKHTYSDCRSKFDLPSQMACNAVRTVIGSYRTMVSNGDEWTECHYAKPQMTLSWNRDYSLNRERFSIGTLSGRIKLSYAKSGMERYFDNPEYRFGAAKVVFKHGRFYLHISVAHDVEEVDNQSICNVVGHDRGLRFIVASYGSDGGSSFVSGSDIKHRRAHYKELRRQLQRVGTPSSRRRLKAIGQRENRWMQNVNHCISKALVESLPKGTLHVIEDLSGIRAATERVLTKHRYVTVSWAYYDLEQKLMYKAAEHGQKVIKVDPRYTSQTCPKCGHVDKASRNKHKHIFHCTGCGYESNDDRVGAMNLYRMGIEYLVESQSGISGLRG